MDDGAPALLRRRKRIEAAPRMRNGVRLAVGWMGRLRVRVRVRHPADRTQFMANFFERQ
jgi:hypothetical protein